MVCRQCTTIGASTGCTFCPAYDGVGSDNNFIYGRSEIKWLPRRRAVGQWWNRREWYILVTSHHDQADIVRLLLPLRVCGIVVRH